ncbi:hypothetical protein ABPG77_002493 [Micractinium sp. CCAP 211/92]
MRRPSHDDVEAAQRLSEPLLARRSAGGSGGGGPGSSSDVEQGGAAGPPSRGLSPDARSVDLHPAATPGGAFRLTKRTSTAQQEAREEAAAAGHDQPGGLVLKDAEDDGRGSDVRELEVEVVAGAVAEAVAEAVQEAVQEAVHDAVQQAIEENVQFDVRANFNTLIAVTGVILFWRGVWNTWDVFFGSDSLLSNVGSLVLGLVIMLLVRFWDLPLVTSLPGG